MGEIEIRRAVEILRGLRIGVNKDQELSPEMQDQIENLKSELAEW